MAQRYLQAAFLGGLLAVSLSAAARADAIYQWSVPVSGVSAETGAAPQAYLWIPPHCTAVRAVVLGQHNLLEEPLFEARGFRRVLTKACIGEVWVTPMFDMVFDFSAGAGERTTAMMNALAEQSGYRELAWAPIAPVGHSAAASFPWNFGAWAPERTLAIVSLKGDAPQTPLTGSGKSNPVWGDRSIDGVPALMVMGEYEWREDRLAPALAYQQAHPKAAISLYADVGHGHFDVSDDLADYVARFIVKAADARLVQVASLAGATPLRPVDPELGWRADRWRADAPALAPAAPASRYTGPAESSFWYFDREMAERAQAHYRQSAGKAPQLVGFVQDETVVQPRASHAQIELGFKPLADGVSFKLGARFLDHVPAGSPQPAQWTGRAAGAPLGNAAGPIVVTKETGPVIRTGPDTWTIAFNRVGFDNRKRSGDVWFVAGQAGDARFKSASQQAIMRVPVINAVGLDQALTFELPATASKRASGGRIALAGFSDRRLQVRYYVKQGPAQVWGQTLVFDDIPRSAKRPIKVTVVAWQLGVSGKIKSAAPVEQNLLLSN